VVVDANGYHALSGPTAITDPRLVHDLDAAVDGLGNRMVVFEWEFDDHSTRWIAAISAPDRGPFDDWTPVSSSFGTFAPPAFEPTIVADANGRFLAAWRTGADSFDRISYAFALPPG
jgi:hypothetical protein